MTDSSDEPANRAAALGRFGESRYRVRRPNVAAASSASMSRTDRQIARTSRTARCTARVMMREGFRLDADEAASLGDHHFAWVRRLGLTVAIDDNGDVIGTPR